MWLWLVNYFLPITLAEWLTSADYNEQLHQKQLQFVGHLIPSSGPWCLVCFTCKKELK